MVFVPQSFFNAQAQAGAAVASQVAQTQVEPSGSFFGELGGLLRDVGGTAISTVGDIVRLRAAAEQQRALQKVQARLIPGQIPTAEDRNTPYLPTQYVPIAPAGDSSNFGLLALGGLGLVALVLLTRKR